MSQYIKRSERYKLKKYVNAKLNHRSTKQEHIPMLMHIAAELDEGKELNSEQMKFVEEIRTVDQERNRIYNARRIAKRNEKLQKHRSESNATPQSDDKRRADPVR